MSIDLESTLDYHVVDVFSDRAYAGNPLAVVLGGDALSTEQMQSIANEFNLSETTFPLPPTAAEADYRVRIFTPGQELPFAGHPSIGTAWLLHQLDRLGTGRRTQECGAGLLAVDVAADGVTLTGAAPHVGDPLDRAPFLDAVGLGETRKVTTPVRWAGTGIDFAFVHVPDDAVARCRPNLAALAALGNAGVSVFSYADGVAHARVFAAAAGVPEDPATGSAALALGAFLVESGMLRADGDSSYLVRQGIEMGRPSTLACTVVAAAGHATACRVRGSVVPIASGRIRVP